MNLKYNNTFVDLLVFNLAYSFISLPYHVVFSLIGLSVLFEGLLEQYNSYIFAFLGELLSERYSTIVPLVVEGIFWYLICWVVAAFLICLELSFTITKNYKISNYLLILQDESFIEKNDYSEKSINWVAVSKILIIGGYITIFVNGNAEIILPDRSFRSSTEKKLFYAEILSKWKISNQKN